jgi:hypothetical protein
LDEKYSFHDEPVSINDVLMNSADIFGFDFLVPIGQRKVVTNDVRYKKIKRILLSEQKIKSNFE